jgi:hypothetical protein
MNNKFDTNQLRMVVFANSVKHSKHCIAGKLVDSKKWVRPVANDLGAELSTQQIKYKNPYGEFHTKTLQIIKFTYLKHVPLINQPENYLIDDQAWKQNYSINESDINDYLDMPSDLWGSEDRVSYNEILNKEIIIKQSLYLVKVDDLKLHKNSNNKRRASFVYNQASYDLAVTDPFFEKNSNRINELQNILCISLGEEYRGSCFKLVAAIY